MQSPAALDFLDPKRKLLFDGRFAPVELIGEGSTSWVLKANDLKNRNKVVAVKLLKPVLLESPEELRHFWTEVSITQTLSHPNIIEVIGCGKHDNGLPFLVMEYAPGGSLRQLVLRRPDRRLSFIETLEVLNSVSMALSHAHQLGTVHRDLKPANILISKDGDFKLSDFGAAYQRSLSKVTDDEGRVGTPYYMSPEQIQGQPTGPQADVYALGIVAYELMMGHPPFQGAELHEVFSQHMKAYLPKNTVEEAGVPCWFESLLFKATKKDPALRHPNAKDFRRELLQNARRELGGNPLEGIVNYFRPNGILCTQMRRRGWSRPYTALALVVCGIAFYVAYRFLLP